MSVGVAWFPDYGHIVADIFPPPCTDMFKQPAAVLGGGKVSRHFAYLGLGVQNLAKPAYIILSQLNSFPTFLPQ